MLKICYYYIYDGFVIITFICSVFYGYKKGLVSGLASICRCIFSFFAANVFGRFFLKSSFLNFLNLRKMFGSNNSLLKLLFQNNLENDVVNEKLVGFNGNLSNYLIFWVLIVVLFMSFKQFFYKLKHFSKFVKKIPFLNDLDGLLGGVFGALEAIIFLVAVACGCFIIVILTKNSLNFLNLQIISETKLFFLFYKILPFAKI